MNWIFPMAGYGTRTSSLGEYKPFIEVLPNMSILKVCLLGLKSQISAGDELVFIATKEQDTKYNVSTTVNKLTEGLGLRRPHVVLLDNTPPGQAFTVRQGVLPIERVKDVSIVVNPDQCVLFNVNDVAAPAVGLYFNPGTKSCFFDLDVQKKKIREIKEKRPISSYASAGLFVFPNIDELVKAVEWGENNKKTHNGELHMGPCMGYFPDLNYFKTDMKFDLGDLNQVKRFAKIAQETVKWLF